MTEYLDIYPGPKLSKKSLQYRTYLYLLRNIKPKYLNHVWGFDLTYIGIRRGRMYLEVIIDLASIEKDHGWCLVHVHEKLRIERIENIYEKT